VNNFVSKNDWSSIFKDNLVEKHDSIKSGNLTLIKALIPKEPIEFLNYSIKFKKMLNIFYEKCISGP